jgi:hypothetical protein
MDIFPDNLANKIVIKDLKLKTHVSYASLLEEGWTEAEARALILGAAHDQPQFHPLINLWLDEYGNK